MPVVIGQPAFQREFDKPLAAAQAPPAPPVMVSQARRPQMGMEEQPLAQPSLAPPVVVSQARRRPQMGVEEPSSMLASQPSIQVAPLSLLATQPSFTAVQSAVQSSALPSLPVVQASALPSVSAMKNSIRKPRIGNV
jgi:hypothetical protein